MPRFVILEHDFPHLHWDLMFECGPVLRTWRLAEPPVSGKAISAEALGDHRLHYLDYEGPVSGNRGQVRRWAGGEYTTVTESAERWEVMLVNERTNGRAVLERSVEGRWRFILHTEVGERGA